MSIFRNFYPMASKPQRWLVWRGIWLVMALALLGCGGGGVPDAGTPTPNTPSATELAQAANAQLSATWHADTNRVSLAWSDTVKNASVYRVERQQSPTQWSPVQTVSSQGGGEQLKTDTAVDTQGTYRVVAVLASHTVVLRTGSGAESVVVQTGANPPSHDGTPLDAAWLASVGIQLGANDALVEPVRGTVPLSLSGPAGWAPKSVQWFVNLQSLPSAGSAETGFATQWNTQGLVNGQHLITARVEVQADSFIEWRRTVQTEAITVAASMSVLGTQGVVSVRVMGSSAYGVALVRTVLSGASGSTDLGTLTAPNGCNASPCTNFNAFVYSVDTRTLAAGSYTLTSTVTDTRGDTATASKTVNFANPPVLTIDQPRDVQWVHGDVLIEGSSTSESSVTTQITLGNVPVTTSTAHDWSTRYSLAGLPAGYYVLTVRATDAQGLSTTQKRTIVVMSDPAMVQPPLFEMGSGALLIAAQGGDVLWQAGDGTVNSRKASGDNVEMSGSSELRNAKGWQLDQGHVVVYGQADDCALFFCVYAWGPDGQRRNLSALVSGGRSYDQHPVLRYPWVMWIADHRYALQHLNPPAGAVAQYLIEKPASVTGVLGNWRFDFAVSPQANAPDALTAFFWGTLSTSGNPTGPRADVFRWHSSNQSAQALTASEATEVYVQTDGQRAAWQKRAPGSVDAPYLLQVAPATATTTAAASTLSTEMTRFVLKNGLLAWHEGLSGAVTGQRLMLNTSNETITLSTDRGASLLAVAGRSVLWAENSKLYAWRADTGKRVLLDVMAGSPVSDGTAVYLTSGEQGVVYRLSLP
jgi:hypothetical protein